MIPAQALSSQVIPFLVTMSCGGLGLKTDFGTCIFEDIFLMLTVPGLSCAGPFLEEIGIEHGQNILHAWLGSVEVTPGVVPSPGLWVLDSFAC